MHFKLVCNGVEGLVHLSERHYKQIAANFFVAGYSCYALPSFLFPLTLLFFSTLLGGHYKESFIYHPIIVKK